MSHDTDQRWWHCRLWLMVLLIIVAIFGSWYWFGRGEQSYSFNQDQPTLVVRDPPPLAQAVAAAASTPQAVANPVPTPAAAPAPVAKKTWKPIQGDTLSGRFGKDAKAVCELNKLKSCNRIYPGTEYELPDGVEPRKVQLKPRAIRPAAAATPRTATPTIAGIRLYEEVGRAPLRDCGRMSPVESSERAWVRAGLSEEDKAYLRTRIDPKGPRRNITQKEGLYFIPKGVVLPFVTFCRGGDVEAVGPMLTAWKDGKAVPSERFVLPSGKALAWMWECNNWVSVPAPEKERDIPGRGQTAVIPGNQPTTPPPGTPPGTPLPRLQADKEAAVTRFDRDAFAHVGGDRDVVYGGVEAAGYPSLHYFDWGRYALGAGFMANAWKGETPTGYAHDGVLATIDVAHKWSNFDRQSLGLKFPSVGYYEAAGSQGAFNEHRRALLACARVSWDDAKRERYGETMFPEYEVWASYCKVLKQTKWHEWFGQRLDGSTMPGIKRFVGVGGRVYLSKDLTKVAGPGGLAAKVQPFVEVGANETAPFSHTAHAYVGLRTVDKVWGCGIGVHMSQAGKIPGGTCTYNIGRDLELSGEQERWTATVESLRLMGMAVDEDD